MAKFSKSQKAERVLLLLLGLGDDRIAVPLRDAGFSKADIKDQNLLRKLGILGEHD